LENTDHPKALCPDKKKVISNLFYSHPGIKNIEFQ